MSRPATFLKAFFWSFAVFVVFLVSVFGISVFIYPFFFFLTLYIKNYLAFDKYYK